MASALLLLALIAGAAATTYFSESFDKDWESRWVKSQNKESEGSQGVWGVSAGKYFLDAEDKGLQTTQDARFYQISAEFPEFSNKDKDLIIQYTVKHEQKIDCGGGYLKVLPAEGIDQSNFNGDSPYNIMFGPDICGSSTKKVHVIFNYKGTNHLVKTDIKCETDEFTHLYTLVVHPNNTVRVLIDQKQVWEGDLKVDFGILPPKEIQDPAQSKPADWVDDKMIPDPEDKKPEGWDDIPAQLADPDAQKPEDWDDELDGEWEAPMIDNPEYKGEWKAKQIENPAYKGAWIHPMIPNPDYFEDDTIYFYPSTKYAGIEVWQVKSGTIFDNILITDDRAEADKQGAKIEEVRAAEKKAHEKVEAERKEKEEAERKAREAEEAEPDHDEEEEEAQEKDEL